MLLSYWLHPSINLILGEDQMCSWLSPPFLIASTCWLSPCIPVVLPLRETDTLELELQEHWGVGHMALLLPKDVSSPSNMTPLPFSWGSVPAGQSQPWSTLSKAGGRAVCQPHSSQPGSSSLLPTFSAEISGMQDTSTGSIFFIFTDIIGSQSPSWGFTQSELEDSIWGCKIV